MTLISCDPNHNMDFFMHLFIFAFITLAFLIFLLYYSLSFSLLIHAVLLNVNVINNPIVQSGPMSDFIFFFFSFFHFVIMLLILLLVLFRSSKSRLMMEVTLSSVILCQRISKYH